MRTSVLLIWIYLGSRLLTGAWLFLLGGFIAAPIIAYLYYVLTQKASTDKNRHPIKLYAFHSLFIIGILFQYDIGDARGWTTLDRILSVGTDNFYVAPYMESIYKAVLPDSEFGFFLSGIFSFLPLLAFSLLSKLPRRK